MLFSTSNGVYRHFQRNCQLYREHRSNAGFIIKNWPVSHRPLVGVCKPIILRWKWGPESMLVGVTISNFQNLAIYIWLLSKSFLPGHNVITSDGFRAVSSCWKFLFRKRMNFQRNIAKICLTCRWTHLFPSHLLPFRFKILDPRMILYEKGSILEYKNMHLILYCDGTFNIV